jgi:hypothetical protein
MTRRALIGTLGALVLTALGAGEWRRLRRPAAGDLAALLRSRLSHLNLDPRAADDFAAEYARRFGAQIMAVHRTLTFGGLSTGLLRHARPDRARSVVRLERRLVGDFLRATTYFREPRGAVVRFVAYPDPYEGPCTNPFADLSLPS